jgi:hypothetical protein
VIHALQWFMPMTWNDRYLTLFDRSAALYRGGEKDFNAHYSGDDLAFLGTIGYQPREFFDFVEDFCEEGEPTPTTALLVAAVRRDYFLTVQGGVWLPADAELLTRDSVPGFGDELDGLAYLPRILAKANAKLRGGLDPDLMYGCGGDRHFLQKHGDLHPADFLRHVWAAGDDHAKLVAWIKRQA